MKEESIKVMQFVFDASVSGSRIIELEKTPISELLLKRILDRQLAVVMPSLWIFEMLNLLKTCILRNRISQEDGAQGVRTIQAIPVEVLHPDFSLQRSMFRLLTEHHISVYDAAYFAVAGHLSCTFLTANDQLLSLRNQFSFVSSLDEITDIL